LEGLRPYTQPSLFEALVKAILQQQVSYRFAYQLIRDLVLVYGTRCRLGELELWDFPSAERLSKLSEEDLRAHRIGYKAKYIRGLTQRICTGELDLERLAKEETASLLQTLDDIPGVGPWTAELTVLSGLQRLEVFPYDDLVVQNLISKLYLDGARTRRREVQRVAQRWGDQAPMILYFLMAAQVLNHIT
jgi:DNA-3-methyladenine glycosylase II